MPDWTVSVIERTRLVSLPQPAYWVAIEAHGRLPSSATISGFLARDTRDGLNIEWPVTGGRVYGVRHTAFYIRDAAARAALLAAIERQLRAGAGR